MGTFKKPNCTNHSRKLVTSLHVALMSFCRFFICKQDRVQVLHIHIYGIHTQRERERATLVVIEKRRWGEESKIHGYASLLEIRRSSSTLYSVY